MKIKLAVKQTFFQERKITAYLNYFKTSTNIIAIKTTEYIKVIRPYHSTLLIASSQNANFTSIDS